MTVLLSIRPTAPHPLAERRTGHVRSQHPRGEQADRNIRDHATEWLGEGWKNVFPTQDGMWCVHGCGKCPVVKTRNEAVEAALKWVAEQKEGPDAVHA